MGRVEGALGLWLRLPELAIISRQECRADGFLGAGQGGCGLGIFVMIVLIRLSLAYISSHECTVEISTLHYPTLTY